MSPHVRESERPSSFLKVLAVFLKYSSTKAWENLCAGIGLLPLACRIDLSKAAPVTETIEGPPSKCDRHDPFRSTSLILQHESEI